jgi:O-antigen/teichoic acid export membrane protein
MTVPSPRSDSGRHLETEHLQHDLRALSARGGAATVAAQSGKLLMGVISTAILARMLAPEDFGLVAMVTAITGFIGLFRDMGLSLATIQKPTITHREVSTLFWINVTLGGGLVLVSALLAPAVAWFYGDPRLTWITLAVSGTFVFGGIAAQHRALLSRRMRFGALATIDTISYLVAVAATLAFAAHGAGYWALVLLPVALEVTSAAGAWMVCRWRPGRPGPLHEIRALLGFGGNLTGFNVVNYFARNLDNLLIGRFWGPYQLGLYAKAYQLLLLPIQLVSIPVGSVAVSALSRLADSPEAYRQAARGIIEKVAFLTMPAVAIMIGTSDWLVVLVLGPQWGEASRIFAWLGIAALTQPIAHTTGWLLITQDRTRDLLWWGLIGGGIAILSIVAGLRWGAVGVAMSYSLVGFFIRTPLLFWYVGRSGPITAADFYRMLRSPALAAFAALASVLAFRSLVHVPGPLVGLVAATPIGLVAALALIASQSEGRKALRSSAVLLSLALKPGCVNDG